MHLQFQNVFRDYIRGPRLNEEGTGRDGTADGASRTKGKEREGKGRRKRKVVCLTTFRSVVPLLPIQPILDKFLRYL
jgi:hypothetical protein